MPAIAWRLYGVWNGARKSAKIASESVPGCPWHTSLEICGPVGGPRP